MRPLIISKETGKCYYFTGQALLQYSNGRLYDHNYFIRTVTKVYISSSGKMFDGFYHYRADMDYESYTKHDGFIFYDNLFKFIQKGVLRKLYLSMVPNVFYNNMSKASNKVYNDVKFGIMGKISNSIDGNEYKIAYKLLQSIPKATIEKMLEVITINITDISEFYLDILAMIYYNTDRSYLMELLGQKYKGHEEIKPFKPNFSLGDLLDYDSLNKANIHYKYSRECLVEDTSVIKKTMSDVIYYKIKYPKADDWNAGDRRLDQLDKETNPNSYIFMDMINVYAEKKSLQYIDAIYNVAISNPKIAADYIRKNKKVILGRVLKNVNTSLKKKRLDITSDMLKFDNITVTNDCRLVCKLSLKAELAKEIVELTNQEKAMLLYRKGLNRKEIAEKLGVTYQSACRYVKGM
jgi:hypothetical protein